MSELSVKIYGRLYRLAVSTGEEELLSQCAQAVDKRMTALHEAGKVMNGDQIASLTALEIAYDAAKADHEAQEKIKTLTDRIAELEAALAQRQESDATPQVSSASEAELLRDIDHLCELCENAIFSEMRKKSLL